MKKILFIICALFLTSTFFAQEDEFCQTQPSSTHLPELGAIKGLDYSNYEFYIKIYVHVLRKVTEPKLGLSTEGVNRQLKTLYDDFDPLGIHFVWNGEINYLENNDYYSNPGNNAEEILSSANNTDGIDIYFVDDLSSSVARADDIGGSALIVGGFPSANIFGDENNQQIPQTPLSWTKVISHEMGHVLYLWHTHHGTFDEETGSECPEYVNGSNSGTCGDYIEDTPADPNINRNVSIDTCAYEPDLDDEIPEYDQNGDEYQPDTTNHMSYSHPNCRVNFTPNQKTRMKNAIWYLPVLHNTILLRWSYIRTTSEDCYVCGIKQFTLYSNFNPNLLTVLENTTNINVTYIPIDNLTATITVTNLHPTSDEGSSGSFLIGNQINSIDNVTQPIWVGLPQAVSDDTLTGDTEVSSAVDVIYSINNRLDGIDYYTWSFPEPNELNENLINADNPNVWEYRSKSKYSPAVRGNTGNDTGIVTIYGENSCGLGSNGEDNDLCVVNLDDNDGEPDCSTPPQPIYYYPNPANSLLEIDLSLQEYKVFDVIIYNENQIVQYSGQSTNIIKTVDVASLTNGTFYLHIYDGSDLILSAILIINH